MFAKRGIAKKPGRARAKSSSEEEDDRPTLTKPTKNVRKPITAADSDDDDGPAIQLQKSKASRRMNKAMKSGATAEEAQAAAQGNRLNRRKNAAMMSTSTKSRYAQDQSDDEPIDLSNIEDLPDADLPSSNPTELTEEDKKVQRLLIEKPDMLNKMARMAKDKREMLRKVGGDEDFIPVGGHGNSDALIHSERNVVDRLALEVEAKHRESNSEDDDEFERLQIKKAMLTGGPAPPPRRDPRAGRAYGSNRNRYNDDDDVDMAPERDPNAESIPTVREALDLLDVRYKLRQAEFKEKKEEHDQKIKKQSQAADKVVELKENHKKLDEQLRRLQEYIFI